ncbi:hypothetical protein B566_EDAN012998 [Ephemera danica]|nr:hypothetical protein B566_EDAN012998 [Ephemera danica]
MIGAMPAVAVRHERRKQEKKKPRPGQLYLANYATKQTTSSSRNTSPCPSRGGSPSPASQGTSPLSNTPPHHDDLTSPGGGEEFYVCARVSVLHVIVVSFLLGIILLIVGLVQLKPGADASDHRYYILGAGTLLLSLGILLTLIRCIMIPVRKYLNKRRLRLRRMKKEESAALALAKASQNSNGGNHDVQTIQEVSSAEERAAAELEHNQQRHHHHHRPRNGSTTTTTALLTSCQSVSIEMGPHSSRDTLVSAKSPSDHDDLQHKASGGATAANGTTASS